MSLSRRRDGLTSIDREIGLTSEGGIEIGDGAVQRSLKEKSEPETYSQ